MSGPGRPGGPARWAASVGSAAFALLAGIGAATSPACTRPHATAPRNTDAFECRVSAGSRIATAQAPLLLTGTVTHVPPTESCARGAARYELVSRHHRVRIGTHRPRVERLLNQVAGKSIVITVAGHRASEPRCPHVEVDAAWLPEARPQPLRSPARRT